MIGGDTNRRQFVEYDILDQNIIDHGEDYLSEDLQFRGYGQYYAQFQNTLYFLDWKSNGNYLMIYDLDTQSLSQQIALTEGYNVGHYGCIA